MTKHKNFHGINSRKFPKAYEAVQRRSPSAFVRKLQRKKIAPGGGKAEQKEARQ